MQRQASRAHQGWVLMTSAAQQTAGSASRNFRAKPTTAASPYPIQCKWHPCAPGSCDDELLHAAGIEVQGVGAQLVLEVPQLEIARVDRHQDRQQVLFGVDRPLVSLK